MSGDDLGALASLHDPVRRGLYDLVARAGRDVSRGEAAEAAGISRTLAAFHLDRLVAAGLLESDFRRPERKGPGSGRPAKVYRRSRAEMTVSLPPRDYGALASVLADVVDLLGADEQAELAARRAGERLAGERPGGDRPDAVEVLRERGYEPYAEGERVRLRNCPFHALAERHPVLTCSMNLALCQGLLEGLGENPERASLDPRPGECCVVLSKTNEN
ncbi:helix-turn-helix domain-containing protein [Nonomuraea sp. NPDC046570]|uniref:helix-turn-helix transcriptional regulator n=1 Tax=Nonomuraea sp. NPDC046570 TaxID=3155255 RepID=UPI0033CB2CA2